MNKKINLVELLKDCHKGMELDCVICNGVTFVELDRNPNYPIVVVANDGYVFSLTKYGQVHNIDDAKCVIFPKGKTTWEGFHRPFKDGDIVVKDRGYKWNAETKTLEKLVVPNFKVGDKIRHKVTNKDDVYEINRVYDDSYGLVGFTWMIYMKYQDNYELVPNKFDISTLKPFESRVLVRDEDCDIWRASFWGCLLEKREEYRYDTIRGVYAQCVPYEGNEHLLGTSDECDEYYKIWE